MPTAWVFAALIAVPFARAALAQGPTPSLSAHLAAADEKLRWVDTEMFSVRVPRAWSEPGEKALDSLRSQAEELVRVVFPKEETLADAPDRVGWFAAFESEDKKARLFALMASIPPPQRAGRPYIERQVLGYADRNRADGIVSAITPSEERERNGLPAVEIVARLADGRSVYAVHVWTPVYRERIGVIAALVEEDASADDLQEVSVAVDSVRPSDEVAEAQKPGLREYLRELIWSPRNVSPARLWGQRVAVVLLTFIVFFYMSLRMLYLTALVWYRIWKMEDEVDRLMRRARSDTLRLGLVFSERSTYVCALFSIVVTSSALIWLTA